MFYDLAKHSFFLDLVTKISGNCARPQSLPGLRSLWTGPTLRQLTHFQWGFGHFLVDSVWTVWDVLGWLFAVVWMLGYMSD